MIQNFAFFCNKYLTLRYFFHNSVTIGKGLFLCVKKTVVFFYTLFYSLTFCFILILVKKTFCCYQYFFLLYKTGKASYFIGK